MAHPEYGSEDIVKRGEWIYQQKIRTPDVVREYAGKYLAIDVESGDYEIAEDELAASDRTIEKHPGAAVYVLRIGHSGVAKLGFRS
ncbi:MAG: hypothetical protein ACLQVD_11550 [Capsulimonadaceae bacterium]